MRSWPGSRALALSQLSGPGRPRRAPADAVSDRLLGLGVGDSAVGAAARAPGLGRLAAPAPEAVVAAVAGGVLELGLGLRRPPDEPDGEEDRNLQDHGEEDDRPHALHNPAPVYPRYLGVKPSSTQASRAATCPSSSPTADSVGTSSVGVLRRSAHS